MGLWGHMMAPKPNVNVFFEQKTVHLMNGVWDPFQVLGPISNPLLNIGGESFLDGKDVWLAQLVLVVCNVLVRDMLCRVAILSIQLLGLLVESIQAQAMDVTLIIPLMSTGGRPSRGLAQWVWQHSGNGVRE